jgi:hypothetical protein
MSWNLSDSWFQLSIALTVCSSFDLRDLEYRTDELIPGRDHCPRAVVRLPFNLHL